MRGPVDHAYYDAIRQLERVENVFKQVEHETRSHTGAVSKHTDATTLGCHLGHFMTNIDHALHLLYAVDIEGLLAAVRKPGIQEHEVD